MRQTTPDTGSRRHRLASLCAALCIAFVMAACHSPLGPGYAPPTVAIDRFDLSRPGLLTQELTVLLTVQNQMPRDLVIDAVDLELEVNGTHLGSGTLLKAIPLPADAAVTARVPVKVKTQDILEAFFALARDPTLAYAISGHVRLSGAESGSGSGSGEESVPFDEDGEFRLPIGASGLEVMNGSI